MSPVDLPYLWRPRQRGKPTAYYRRGGVARRIRGPDGKPLLPGDAGFLDAYQALHRAAGGPVPTAGHPAGSLAALCDAFQASVEWQALAPATQRDYRKVLDPLEARYGALPVATMPQAFVFKLRDEFSRNAAGEPTPRRANRVVDVLRLLLAWGVRRGWRRDNPAIRTGRLKTGPGYATWTALDFDRFMAAAPEPMRRAAALCYYSGQRKQDCLVMPRSARRGGAVELVQIKTGARAWIPEHPALTRILDAAPPTSATTILTRPDGRPWRADHFNHVFARAVKDAGLIGLSFHGLRKGAAARLAEAGASASDIQAVTGHRTLSEVTRYTRDADQRRRAARAIGKLER